MEGEELESDCLQSMEIMLNSSASAPIWAVVAKSPNKKRGKTVTTLGEEDPFIGTSAEY